MKNGTNNKKKSNSSEDESDNSIYEENLENNFSSQENSPDAGFGIRFLAVIINFLIFLDVVIFYFWIGFGESVDTLTKRNEYSFLISSWSFTLFLILLLVVKLLMLQKLGGSPGKLVLGLRIVSRENEELTWKEILLRRTRVVDKNPEGKNLFRIILAFLLMALGIGLLCLEFYFLARTLVLMEDVGIRQGISNAINNTISVKDKNTGKIPADFEALTAPPNVAELCAFNLNPNKPLIESASPDQKHLAIYVQRCRNLGKYFCGDLDSGSDKIIEVDKDYALSGKTYCSGNPPADSESGDANSISSSLSAIDISANSSSSGDKEVADFERQLAESNAKIESQVKELSNPQGALVTNPLKYPPTNCLTQGILTGDVTFQQSKDDPNKYYLRKGNQDLGIVWSYYCQPYLLKETADYIFLAGGRAFENGDIYSGPADFYRIALRTQKLDHIYLEMSEHLVSLNDISSDGSLALFSAGYLYGSKGNYYSKMIIKNLDGTMDKKQFAVPQEYRQPGSGKISPDNKSFAYAVGDIGDVDFSQYPMGIPTDKYYDKFAVFQVDISTGEQKELASREEYQNYYHMGHFVIDGWTTDGPSYTYTIGPNYSYTNHNQYK